MAQVASKTCEMCVSGLGYHYCEQCDQLFCDGCRTSHLRTTMTKNHTFTSRSSSYMYLEVKQYCKGHNEQLLYYCRDCNTPTCQVCTIENHKTHDFFKPKNSTEAYKANIGKEIEMK